jgi:hypothetical protein
MRRSPSCGKPNTNLATVHSFSALWDITGNLTQNILESWGCQNINRETHAAVETSLSRPSASNILLPECGLLYLLCSRSFNLIHATMKYLAKISEAYRQYTCSRIRVNPLVRFPTSITSQICGFSKLETMRNLGHTNLRTVGSFTAWKSLTEQDGVEVVLNVYSRGPGFKYRGFPWFCFVSPGIFWIVLWSRQRSASSKYLSLFPEKKLSIQIDAI